MSLRKGHMRSKMWAPPTLVDDWQDEANCRGMMTTDIPLELCATCPVMEQCADLGAEVEAIMGSGRRQDRRPMPGTWGGCNTPEKKDHPSVGNMGGGRYPKGSAPINGGTCSDDDCERGAYRRGMCGMHYQRQRAAERGHW